MVTNAAILTATIREHGSTFELARQSHRPSRRV